tara:strand:+ start:3021 stop:3791 length:771 start_codon:yes stop_codon:yes gene_type:complete
MKILIKKIFFIGLILSLALTFQPANGQSNFTIKIVRTALNSSSTTGELYINNEFVCHTLELPWKNNKSFISNIPNGNYGGILRYDKNGVRGIQHWRIELTGTEPRTFIQIHKGNSPNDIEGCVVVGNEVLNKQNKLKGGTSKLAFDNLKKLFYGTTSPNATPDKNIVVIIEYGKTYTTYEYREDREFYIKYHNDGIWKDESGQSLKEIKRDLNYIYFKDEGIFFRLPLKGGCMQVASSVNGNYKTDPEGGCLDRKN